MTLTVKQIDARLAQKQDALARRQSEVTTLKTEIASLKEQRKTTLVKSKTR
jgi:hypothetical protein